MKPTHPQFELSQLRNFVKTELTEKLVKALKQTGLDYGFNENALRRNHDLTAAFHGFNCCLNASQISQFLLKENGNFSEFAIVSPIKVQPNIRGELHYFLKPIAGDFIIDSTARQQCSTRWIDQTIQRKLAIFAEQDDLTDDEKMLQQAIFQYIRQQRDINKIQEMNLEITKQIQPIFVGKKAELIEITQEAHRNIIAPTLNFPTLLAQHLQNHLPDFWAGNSQEWKIFSGKVEPKMRQCLEVLSSKDQSAKPSSSITNQEMSRPQTKEKTQTH